MNGPRTGLRSCVPNLESKSKPFGRTTNNLFHRYGGDQSRADAALCAMLVAFVGRDPQKIEDALAHRRWANALSGHPGMTIGPHIRMHLIFLLCQTDLFGKIK